MRYTRGFLSTNFFFSPHWLTTQMKRKGLIEMLNIGEVKKNKANVSEYDAMLCEMRTEVFILKNEAHSFQIY